MRDVSVNLGGDLARLRTVEEEAPDEWDLRMLEEIKNDPDCQTPASAEEVKRVLEDV